MATMTYYWFFWRWFSAPFVHDCYAPRRLPESCQPIRIVPERVCPPETG